jgi:hypothetical protein
MTMIISSSSIIIISRDSIFNLITPQIVNIQEHTTTDPNIKGVDDVLNHVLVLICSHYIHQCPYDIIIFAV